MQRPQKPNNHRSAWMGVTDSKPVEIHSMKIKPNTQKEQIRSWVRRKVDEELRKNPYRIPTKQISEESGYSMASVRDLAAERRKILGIPEKGKRGGIGRTLPLEIQAIIEKEFKRVSSQNPVIAGRPELDAAKLIIKIAREKHVRISRTGIINRVNELNRTVDPNRTVKVVAQYTSNREPIKKFLEKKGITFRDLNKHTRKQG